MIRALHAQNDLKNGCPHPVRCDTRYRGVKLDLSKNYPKGKTFHWWAFSSCTTDGAVLTDPLFMGTSGARTMFHIHCSTAKDIMKYSIYDEKEMLLPPGVKFVVEGSTTVPGAAGLHAITIKEVPSRLIPFPRTKSARLPLCNRL